MTVVRRARVFLVFFSLAMLLATAPGWSSPSPEVIEPVDYTPGPGKDFSVSSPEAQGLDPMLVARLYSRASKVDTTRSVLVIKNGRLVAEAYFHGGWEGSKERLQSVTKSITSALAGIALEQGFLSSIDRPMLDYFPELAYRIRDDRKAKITIRHMLQMRAGFPWEESTPELFRMLYHGFQPSLLVDVPLVRDPGTGFEYSNLTAHLAGVVVSRATKMDLRSFAEKNLFGPLDIEAGEWIKDWEGNYNGHADLHLTARDMAKFGMLYLNDGTWNGKQVVSSAWVRDSLESYSRNAWKYRVGRNFTDMEYGYFWWSARAGRRRFNFAWGHGGQQIALVSEENMVVVVTADPLFGQHGDGPWRLEKANLNLVGDFVASLPAP